MRKFELKKLVRDGIVPSMEAMGQEVESRQVVGAERLRETGRKVLEETAEFDPDKPDVAELADAVEAAEAVISTAQALAADMGVSAEDLAAIQLKRRQERGGFEDGIFVETVALQDDDEWVEYYASEPDRFKEIKE